MTFAEYAAQHGWKIITELRPTDDPDIFEEVDVLGKYNGNLGYFMTLPDTEPDPLAWQFIINHAEAGLRLLSIRGQKNP